MEVRDVELNETLEGDKPWSPENTVEVNQDNILALTEKICTDPRCRYRQLALRILLHLIAVIDEDGKVSICARKFAESLHVNYDTVTKCLKYLREIGVMWIER